MEELNKEEEKEKEQQSQDILENREKLFPNMKWEPRVDAEEQGLKVLLDGPAKEVKLNRDNWGVYQSYAVFEPLLWYWSTAQWQTETGEDGPDENGFWRWHDHYTPWLIIAADFYYLTSVPLCKPEGKSNIKHYSTNVGTMEGATIDQQVTYFKRASNTLIRLVGGKLWHTVKDKHLLADIGAETTSGVRGRLLVRKPEKVNQLLHKVGLALLKDQTWKIKIKWPEVGTTLWKEKRQKDGIWQGVQLVGEGNPRKRLTRKQKEPEGWTESLKEQRKLKNNPISGIRIDIKDGMNKDGNLKYTNEVRESMEWNDEEKKALEKVKHLPQNIRMREEQRLIFNRTADKKGHHVLAPFKNIMNAITKCANCNKEIDLMYRTGPRQYIYIMEKGGTTRTMS